MEKVLDAGHHPPQRTGCRISELCSKQTGINLNTRFKRYFFARVDEFLADKMKLNPKHSIADLVTKTGAKTGFHVEHILAWNSENKALFDGDEERFEQDRKRLGDILLLKGKDNQSSNKEPYSEKLKSYANTLYWNETLRADSYKSKLDMTALKDQLGLELEALDQFGPDQLEARRHLAALSPFHRYGLPDTQRVQLGVKGYGFSGRGGNSP